MGSKWDIEKFTGDNDFGLWKVKIEAVLIQQKSEKALKGEGVLPVTMSRAKKIGMVEKARSVIVLCLGDKVLREVAKELKSWHRVVKVRVFIYDKVFDSSAIPKATTLLIQDGGVKGHHGATCKCYEDASVLVVCCLEDEEGDVSHLVNDA
ncbi:hypothetical protein MTR_3g463880 [Medicago truncatula]|uniref:Uncharacterized protein n=1 Tax=Medicago truncatula TaxID=3880 RepID=A0A072UXG5_MEDTR|nr:hypothetical protein MTR_3g463880 [Medicago truncatula]